MPNDPALTTPRPPKTAADLEKALDLQPHKYYDPKLAKHVIKVQPGTHYVSRSPSKEVITTTLGSCVSVCILDKTAGIGGMNHFMLPESDSGTWSGVSAALRFGNYAMEVLINDILRMGGAKNRLEIKVFGGADLNGAFNQIGTKNVKFIRKFLSGEHLAPSAEHLGGAQARRLLFFPDTGKVKMKLLDNAAQTVVIREERGLKNSMDKQPVEGSIELF